jgi:hypothetical protein
VIAAPLAPDAATKRSPAVTLPVAVTVPPEEELPPNSCARVGVEPDDETIDAAPVVSPVPVNACETESVAVPVLCPAAVPVCASDVAPVEKLAIASAARADVPTQDMALLSAVVPVVAFTEYEERWCEFCDVEPLSPSVLAVPDPE